MTSIVVKHIVRELLLMSLYSKCQSWNCITIFWVIFLYLIYILAQKYNKNLTRDQFNKIFDFHTFAEFSTAWKLKNSLIKTYDDFSFLMDGFVNYLKQENIVYIEPAIALFEFPHLDPAKLLDIAYNKLKNSGREFSFIMDLIRGDGKEQMGKQYTFYSALAKDYNIR
jgi:hypothetical protein